LLFICYLEGLKSQLEDAREKLDEIRSSKAQQIARVNGADNPFLKVTLILLSIHFIY